MPATWDFRTILDVDPSMDDPFCVSIAKSKGGRRCKRIISQADLASANRLLDQMDRLKSFKSSVDYLETLAALLLCKATHNNHESNAYLSQVSEVSARWMGIVEEEYQIIKRQRDRARALKAKKELLRMSQTARQMKEELEEEQEEMAPTEFPRTEVSTVQNQFWITGTILEDPFVANTASSQSRNFFHSLPKSSQREIAQATAPANTISNSHTMVKVEEVKVEIGPSDSLSVQNPSTGLPTPESTPQDTDAHLQHYARQGNTTTPCPTNNYRKTNFQAYPPTPPSSIKATKKATEFTFEFQLSPSINGNPKSKLEGPKAAIEKTWSFPVFNEIPKPETSTSVASSSQKQLPAPSLENAAARTPLGERSTSTHNNMKSRKQKATEYEFGNQENMPFKQFNFEVGESAPRIEKIGRIASAGQNLTSDHSSLAFHQTSLESSITFDGETTLKSDLESDHQPFSNLHPTSENQLSTGIKYASKLQLTIDADNESITDIETNPATPILAHQQYTDTQPQDPIPISSPQSKHESQSEPLQKTKTEAEIKPSFGTALITSPKKYKTCLPTTHHSQPQLQSQLLNPTTAHSTSAHVSDRYLADLQIWELVTATEKPLPCLPWEPGRSELRKNGGVIRDKEVVDVYVDERVGCMGFRWRRLGRLRVRILRGLGFGRKEDK